MNGVRSLAVDLRWPLGIALAVSLTSTGRPLARSRGLQPLLDSDLNVDVRILCDSLQAWLGSGQYNEVLAHGASVLTQIENDRTSAPFMHGVVLNTLVEAELRSGKVSAETITRASSALLLLKREETGFNHLRAAQLATACENSAQLALLRGDLQHSRQLLETAFELRRGSSPPDYAGQARTHRRLAALKYTAGDHGTARYHLDRALTLLELASSADPYERVYALGLRSELAWEMRHPTLARDLADCAALHAKARFGTSHPVHSRALGWMARSCHVTGALDLAAALYTEALQTCESEGGLDNVIAAELQRDAAWLHRDMGDYAEARRGLEGALRTFAHRTGDEGLETIRTGGDFGVLLWELGDPGAAIPWLDRFVSNPDLAGHVRQRIRVACALASARFEIGNVVGAGKLFANTAALAESLESLPQESLAQVYSDYATRYFLPMQDYTHTIAYLERALALLEPTTRTLETATAMTRLAEVLCLVGHGERAMPLCEKSLFMRQQTYGLAHPATASSLGLLARIQLMLNNPALAFGAALQAEAAARAHFQSLAAELSEREALRYQTLRDSGLDAALSALGLFHKHSPGTPADTLRAIWDQLLRSRHLVLDEMAARVNSAQDDEELLRLRHEVSSASQRLADLVVQRGGDASAKDVIELAQETLDEAERRFAARNATLRQSTTATGIGEVESALPAGAVLISYVRYNRITFQSRAQGYGPKAVMAEVPHYGAFLLLASGPPTWFDLGAAAAIDSAVEAWRAVVVRAPRGSRHQRLRHEQRCLLMGTTLRRLIWDPLVAAMPSASQIFLVPDGSLHLINLVTLPMGEEHYLIETSPTLHVLSSEKDLVPHDPGPTRRGILVVGGSDYDRPAAPDAAILEVAGTDVEPTSAAGSETTTRQAACGDFDALRFAPLPATSAEADEITGLWRTHAGVPGIGDALKLIGPLANEHAVKSLAGHRRVVHLATHGFYLGGCISNLDRARHVVRYNQGLQSLAVENPLLLCGLALSGANVRDRPPDKRSSQEDGILTAEEVASMDLSGVEWAVLSACESGLGMVQTGEGVLGLRRAFEIAGVRTLILSLWAVDDQATLEWMSRLYETRLAGTSSAAAVREASLKTLSARRQSGRSSHPFYWGAFVATGDWR